MLLEYDIRVVGTDRVNHAFRSMERRLVEHNARVNRVVGTTGARAARGGAGSSGGAGGGGVTAIDRAIARERSGMIRDQEKGEQKLARIRDSAERHNFALRQRHFRQLQATGERADREQIRARMRLEQMAAREKAAIMRAAARLTARETLQTEHARERFARGTFGTAARSARGTVRTVGAVGAGMLAVGGSIAATGALRSVLSTHQAATALTNQAINTPGETRTREQIKGDVMGLAEREAMTSGRETGEVIELLRGFSAIAGNLKAVEKMTPFLMRVADSSDSAPEDVGRTAGFAVTAFQGRGDDLATAMAKTEEVMLAMAGQAKVGSIEMSDMSKNMGRLIASTIKFEGNTEDLIVTMGAMGQLAKQQGGSFSVEDAMTGLVRLGADLSQERHVKRLAKLPGGGVTPFSKESGYTKLRDPLAIIKEILGKTGGDLRKLGGIFGEESIKTFQPFQTAFTEGKAKAVAEGKANGKPITKAEATRAGLENIERIIRPNIEAKMSREELAESSEFARDSPERQLARLVTEFNQVVGNQLLPILIQLVPKVRAMIPEFAKVGEHAAKFAAWFLENPLRNAILLMGAKMVADVAAVGIGNAIAAALAPQVGAAAAALVPFAPAVLAATAAIVAIAAVASAYAGLSKESGGSEGVLAGVKSFLAGEGFFTGVDEHLNQQAREAAEQRKTGPAAPGVPGVPGAPGALGVPGVPLPLAGVLPDVAAASSGSEAAPPSAKAESILVAQSTTQAAMIAKLETSIKALEARLNATLQVEVMNPEAMTTKGAPLATSGRPTAQRL